ncbi:MAG: DHA2 family efflux MFS transporter permease subunit, partial [Acidobacteria bacterium]|nr:DHA2 family efflux MFS transporter permease subunit [Acidobacteriota bacterium]
MDERVAHHDDVARREHHARAAAPTARPRSRAVTERKPVNKWLVTISVTFGTLMGAIDASIVNVAVPHLQSSLGATVEQITWVTTGFVMATVMVMPLTGFLARLFGQKRVYLASLVLFILGSMLCGFARTLPVLVVCRVLQGFGAGALQPTEQAILRQTFPYEEQGMAMAIFGMAVVLGPAFGPTLGGYIVDNYSWPLIFFINIPIGIVAFLMTLRFIRDPEYIKKPERGADWIGLSAMTAGIASLQYVLERGQREDWFSSPTIVILTIVAVFALAFFIVRELRDPHPFVDLRVFKNATFTAGNIIGIVS